MNIMLDPGHGGGKDRGTKVGNIDEAVLNLRICDDVPDTWQTRYIDEAVSLKTRAKLAEGNGLCLVVHCNSNNSDSVHGTEVYILDEGMEGHAGKLLECMPGALGPRRTHYASPNKEHWTNRAYNVLRRHKKLGTPCMLLECGYLSHKGNQEFLESETGVAIVSAAISLFCAHYRRSVSMV